MSSSPRDQRHYVPKSPEELAASMPNWQVWQMQGLYYARWVRGKPTVLVRDEDLLGLKDKMVEAVWKSRRTEGWAHTDER